MKRLVAVLLVAAIAVAWGVFDLGDYLSLEAIKQERGRLQALYEARPATVLVVFGVVYMFLSIVALPAGALLTLLAGAVFGVVVATVVVSFASSFGATLAMLVSRTLLHDWAADRFRGTYERINRGIDRDGAFYLFSLRLVTYLPFFAINIAMGLTRMPVWRYYWVSQLGMLPGTFVFAWAGRKLARIEEVSDVMSPDVVAALLALAAFPWFARSALNLVRAGRAHAGWQRPRRFDCNVVIIGAGAAGTVAARVAASVKAKAVLIEAGRPGGACIDTGCIPSRTLLQSARLAREVRRAEALGLRLESRGTALPRVMQRVRGIITRVAREQAPERYRALGVEYIQGRATLRSPWTVEVNGTLVSARSIILATGARPRVPAIPGLQDSGYFTSETIWTLDRLPRHLLVLGGGPVGCELARAFHDLGSEVTLMGRAPRLLPREDEEVSRALRERFERDGIRVLCGWQAVRVERRGGDCRLTCTPAGGTGEQLHVEGDVLLLATGREGCVDGLGLERLGLRLNERGFLDTNDYLQTDVPNIHAAGDLAGPYRHAHVARYQARYAALNALFGFLRRFAVDYDAIPFVVLCEPQVARVGLTEREARARRIRYALHRFDFDGLERAIIDGAAEGWMKVLVSPGSGRILGVTIVGGPAGEMIGEFVLAMKNGLSLDRVLATLHAHPTWSEAGWRLARAWRRSQPPQRLLTRLAWLHRWRRG